MDARLIVESEGSGPAVLCMHGLGGGAYWFKGLAARLRDRFRVLSLDLPGTGANRSGQAPYSIDNAVAAIAGYLAAEPGPVSLLGHSMGTILGLKLNVALPGRIRSLISVGGLPAVTSAMQARLSTRRDVIRQNGTLAGLGWKAAEGVFSKATLARAPELLALYARQFETQDLATYAECLDSLLASSAADAVPSARLPCLVISGSDDAYAPPEETARFVASLPGPVEHTQFTACGHMPFLEIPEAFSARVGEFLTAYDGPSR